MPRKNISQIEQIYAGQNVKLDRVDHPVKSIRETFRNNIHEANRIAKKELRKALHRTLSKGVPGQGYNEDYAQRKNTDPITGAYAPSDAPVGRSYSASGPVDFKYSGRLWREMVGRGRAKPSENMLQAWVGLENSGKARPQSAPGSAATYGSLVKILKATKPRSAGNPNPFTVDPREREEVAQRTIETLLSRKSS